MMDDVTNGYQGLQERLVLQVDGVKARGGVPLSSFPFPLVRSSASFLGLPP